MHHDLLVWQVGMDLVSEVYALSAQFPKEEIYGLTAQLRRAAVSVPSNIAEGAARTTQKEFLYYLSVARGSLSELETQLFIAQRLKYCTELDLIMEQVNRIFGLLGGLINSLRKECVK